MNPFYTSRSAIEAYHDCPRYRFNAYLWEGKGLASVARSIPLVTGSAVHKGVEHLLKRVQIGQYNPETDIDGAVIVAAKQYHDECVDAGFRGRGVETDRQRQFTYDEQIALVEGLIRAWAIAELPKIIDRYRVIGVEREITPIEIAPGVLFQAKVDAEFQELQTGDYYNYSLKTARAWSELAENTYQNDLQGVTETWAVEENARLSNQRIDTVLDMLGSLYLPAPSLAQITQFLNKKKVDKRVMGVRFCILVKGDRKKPTYNADDPNALYITYSPLIRGYKHFSPGAIEWAHSWFYPNGENKSGKSALGKGWEPFNAWELPMGVKGWVSMLASGAIQPDCGDIIKQQVVTPIEYFRNEKEIEEALCEIVAQEAEVKKGFELLEQCKGDQDKTDAIMVSYFPHRRHQCNWRFGGQCEFKPMCWQPEVKTDPIGSGLYQIRTPHHDAERESFR